MPFPLYADTQAFKVRGEQQHPRLQKKSRRNNDAYKETGSWGSSGHTALKGPLPDNVTS